LRLIKAGSGHDGLTVLKNRFSHHEVDEEHKGNQYLSLEGFTRIFLREVRGEMAYG
jgi:hypothetical protein